MTEEPTDPRPDVELDDLVTTALDRFDDGGATALEAYLGECGAAGDSVRARVAALHRMGFLDSPDDGHALDRGVPERLGEFELRARIGSGGMGIVYRAWQSALDREVALKVVRAEHLHLPGARLRFGREIRAVARLRHENIVAVHSVGEDGGVPYFAMELITGANLAEVIAALGDRRVQELHGRDLWNVVRSHGAEPSVEVPMPALFDASWVRVVFRIVERIAIALSHAHRHGVLHRDLKPSNVMVTPQGRVVLMDFGLASAQGADPVTRSGAMLGSVPYMAPEQLDGSRGAVDERTDVYALGVTLYELLALRPAFVSDRTEVIRQAILTGQTLALSTVNSTVASDAQTVCAAAMAPEPGRRYATAAALRDDVRRFLDLWPVVARPAGVLLHVRRWSQRHPAAAAACAVGLPLVLAIPSMFALQQQAARERIETTLLERDGEARRAGQNLRLAITAVDQMLRRVGDEELAELPGLAPLATMLLDDASGLLGQLQPDNRDDLELGLAVVQALKQAGDLRRQLRDLPAARVAFDEAAAVLARLPEHANEAVDLAGIDLRIARGALARQGGAPDLAEREWHGAIEALTTRLQRRPADSAAKRRLAGITGQLATLEFGRGREAVARELWQRTRTLFAELVEISPADPELLAEAASHELGFAFACERFGDPTAVRDCVARCERLSEAALALAETTPSVRRRLAAQLTVVAGLASVRADPPCRERLLRRTSVVLLELVEVWPGRIGYQRDLANAEGDLGKFLLEAARPLDAGDVLRRGISRLQSVLEAWPEDHVASRASSQLRADYAAVQLALGDVAEAERQWTIAIEEADRAARSRPELPLPRLRVAVMHQRHASFLTTAGRPDDGAVAIAAAIAQLDQARTCALESADLIAIRDSARRIHLVAAEICWCCGDAVGAGEALATATANGARLPDTGELAPRLSAGTGDPRIDAALAAW